jgi:hypothetical protein
MFGGFQVFMFFLNLIFVLFFKIIYCFTFLQMSTLKHFLIPIIDIWTYFLFEVIN